MVLGYSQNSTEYNSSNESGIQSSEELSSYTFFNKMTLLLPSRFKRLGKISIENEYGMASLESENKLVSISIRVKDAVDFSLLKKVHESMAGSTYKGEIIRNETTLINGKSVYIFEQIGYWNESAKKETWVKFYCNNGENLYQCLIRYPEADRIKAQSVITKIINSLTIE